MYCLSLSRLSRLDVRRPPWTSAAAAAVGTVAGVASPAGGGGSFRALSCFWIIPCTWKALIFALCVSEMKPQMNAYRRRGGAQSHGRALADRALR